MSSVNNNLATMMNSLGIRPDAGNPASGLSSMKGREGAFDMQLMMAQQMAVQPEENKEYGAQDLDMGVMNNVLMLEALTALNSIKGLQRDKSTAGTHSALPVDYGVKSPAVKKMDTPDVSGSLSARFESGSKGVSAIGYDRVGGTSYGKYQIASKTGTMDRFIKFLKDKAPQIADMLSQAGPANTGSKHGTMPEIWKDIASKNPSFFEKLQHDFIKQSHYTPAAKMILDKTGVNIDALPGPVREVLWSTSVQHGATGATNLISRAIDKLASSADSKGFPSDLVKEIYGERQGQFSSSTGAVRRSVANRLKQEQNMVLAMLGEGVSKTA